MPRPAALLAFAVLCFPALAQPAPPAEPADSRVNAMRIEAALLELQSRMLEVEAQEKRLAAQKLRLEAEIATLKAKLAAVRQGEPARAEAPSHPIAELREKVQQRLLHALELSAKRELEKLPEAERAERKSRLAEEISVWRRELDAQLSKLFPDESLSAIAEQLGGSDDQWAERCELAGRRIEKQIRVLRDQGTELPQVAVVLFQEYDRLRGTGKRDLLLALMVERVLGWVIERQQSARDR